MVYGQSSPCRRTTGHDVRALDGAALTQFIRKTNLELKTDSKNPIWDFGCHVQHGAFGISLHAKHIGKPRPTHTPRVNALKNCHRKGVGGTRLLAKALTQFIRTTNLKLKTDSKNPIWDFGCHVQHGAFGISLHAKHIGKPRPSFCGMCLRERWARGLGGVCESVGGCFARGLGGSLGILVGLAA